MSGDPRLLEPHRGEIAVLFCDLRGFTPFVASSQPEEVHELLDAYFEALGEHAQRHGATVGAFTGDGLMAFFNDPLPVPDPAHRAVALALDLQGPVRDLLERWRHVGHDIGFGVGIAMGYANIGMIGFEGRRDYTALGPVVNLAARLCAEAPADGDPARPPGVGRGGGHRGPGRTGAGPPEGVRAHGRGHPGARAPPVASSAWPSTSSTSPPTGGC